MLVSGYDPLIPPALLQSEVPAVRTQTCSYELPLMREQTN
jgi:hypothetical protein